jgi:parallel beta-helix repeat protein
MCGVAAQNDRGPALFVSALLLAVAAMPQIVSTQPAASLGDPPSITAGAEDIFTKYRLPPLKDHGTDPLWIASRNLQVLRRAHRLGLHAKSATQAWRAADVLLSDALIAEKVAAPAADVVFAGTRASELNDLLARTSGSVRVSSPELLVDVPILLSGKGTSLDLGHAVLSMPQGGPYMIRVENSADVRLCGGVLVAGEWGVLISNSRDVTVSGIEIGGLSGGGILVTGSDHVVISHNKLHALAAAPVLLHGATQHTVVMYNEITNNHGASNWHAGIVLTDRNADLSASPANLFGGNDFWAVTQSIIQHHVFPHDNVIAFNHIAENHSSGIYLDGSIRNVVVSNDIERNSKEGLCLDYGATANVVAWNVVRANGKRWGKSDLDLKQDFVLQLGRLPDGSSRAKVPGISLDNAAYNQIVLNEISMNYGGGIKIVRTGLYNLIGLNTLLDDNEGRSSKFHFFGIELGSARADVPAKDLDFAPSRGNEVFGNMIRGSHYAGIFFAEGSDTNDIFDNSIFGATAWAMESVRRQPNSTLNNLTNEKLRNIGSGLSPELISLGAGQFDQ